MNARARRERAILRARRRPLWRHPIGLWQIGGYDLFLARTYAQRVALQPELHHCPRCTDQVVDLVQHLTWCRE